jgi:hypothetical protein
MSSDPGAPAARAPAPVPRLRPPSSSLAERIRALEAQQRAPTHTEPPLPVRLRRAPSFAARAHAAPLLLLPLRRSRARARSKRPGR